jgi:hypothetical protein
MVLMKYTEVVFTYCKTLAMFHPLPLYLLTPLCSWMPGQITSLRSHQGIVVHIVIFINKREEVRANILVSSMAGKLREKVTYTSKLNPYVPVSSKDPSVSLAFGSQSAPRKVQSVRFDAGAL